MHIGWHTIRNGSLPGHYIEKSLLAGVLNKVVYVLNKKRDKYTATESMLKEYETNQPLLTRSGNIDLRKKIESDALVENDIFFPLNTDMDEERLTAFKDEQQEYLDDLLQNKVISNSLHKELSSILNYSPVKPQALDDLPVKNTEFLETLFLSFQDILKENSSFMKKQRVLSTCNTLQPSKGTENFTHEYSDMMTKIKSSYEDIEDETDNY